MIRFLITLAFSIIVLPSTGRAVQEFAGRWNMISMNLQVKVKSWGEHCGPQPISYSTKKVRSVEIVARGQHLIFSKGGMRTDRCVSPNPRLSTISKSAVSGNWKRVCETQKNDPKFEKGEYSLVAKGPNRLEYLAISKFDWTLKGDHCIAGSEERRVYVRAGDAQEEKKTGVDKLDMIEQFVEEEVKPGCEEPGPTKRLLVHPRRITLGPGERICFKAVAFDENGCKRKADAYWKATQNGQKVRGLITKGGCFHAGETAADAEGLYVVTARADKRSDSARVSVVFPDLGELFAARLKPLEDLDEIDKSDDKRPILPSADAGDKSPEDRGAGTTAAPAMAPGAYTGSKPTQTGTSNRLIWLISLFIFLGLVGLAAYILLSIKRRSLKNAISPGSKQEVICPECGSSFPKRARFCPHDGRELKGDKDTSEPDSRASTTGIRVGMICPKCHRGYESDARFCPHDKERLVVYSEWRINNRTGRF